MINVVQKLGFRKCFRETDCEVHGVTYLKEDDAAAFLRKLADATIFRLAELEFWMPINQMEGL